MRSFHRLTLAALAAVLLPLAAPAQIKPAAPAPDPCANAADLTTREQILAAVPAEDAAWNDALGHRGIAKTADGWMQYFNGGSATASHRAFAAAFGDYCAAKARAAATKSQAKAVPASRRVELAEIQALKEKSASARKRAESVVPLADKAAPPEPASAPVNCPALCEPVQTCRDAGVGDGNMGSDFRCRKAAKDASAAGCACG